MARATSQARSGSCNSSPSGSLINSSPIRALKKYRGMDQNLLRLRTPDGRHRLLTSALSGGCRGGSVRPWDSDGPHMNPLIHHWFGARSHKRVKCFFAPQHQRSKRWDKKDFAGEVLVPYYLIGQGGVRPVSQGEPKWPGRHRRSSKCRWAWKST